MTEQKILLIFLSQFDLTVSKITKILNYLGEEQSLKGFKKTKFPEDILKREQKEKMLSSAEEELVKTYVVNLADRGIKIVSKFEKEFPQKLYYFEDCPYLLYYMGDISLANKPSISIVGTRKPSSYGYMVTEKLTKELAQAGIVIISGLAYGVDSIAHRKCLEVGGKTIAVLGGGFDHIYPAEHIGLAKEIAEKGLLLSEFRPKYSATKYSFPQRNRIIAGLGDGTLVTEASIKSGTIHTKDFALDYGKELYAVPGNIDSPLSELTNQIITTGQGRGVAKGDDILPDYYAKLKNLENLENKKGRGNIDTSDLLGDEKIIVDILKQGMISIEELTKIANIRAQSLNTCLTTLEIRGLINRVPGGMIALA